MRTGPGETRQLRAGRRGVGQLGLPGKAVSLPPRGRGQRGPPGAGNAAGEADAGAQARGGAGLGGTPGRRRPDKPIRHMSCGIFCTNVMCKIHFDTYYVLCILIYIIQNIFSLIDIIQNIFSLD